MILDETIKEVEVVGEDTSKKAKISENKLAKLQYLLTKGLYKDPITAVIAEWTNNGIDSVVQAGKNPIETPVKVSIYRNEKNQFIFSVEDTGTGLDNIDFEEVCMNYLESTKEGDNDTIGHFGIGMKSFLSLERSATFLCRKEGIERKYIVYEGAEFVNFDLIYEKPTKEENGVIAELAIKDWNERQLFIAKAKAKLAYYDTVLLRIDDGIVQNNIYRNDLFQWSTQNVSGQIHITLKDVYYPIDYEALGISPINIPIAIRLGLADGLKPTPSRESYITNDKVREMLLRKIGEIAVWFVKKYNDTVEEFPNLIKAYKYIGVTDYKVDVEGKQFSINPLTHYAFKHANLRVLEPRLQGVTKMVPFFYKGKSANLMQSYHCVGYVNDRDKIVSKRINLITHIFSLENKVVLTEGPFIGHPRQFLKEKYGRDTLFVRKSLFTYKLGSKLDNKRHHDEGKSSPDTYYNILNLARFPKYVWRQYIQEWKLVLSNIVATFKDETKVESSKEFVDWLAKKKEAQRLNRSIGYVSSSYSGLNKQKGEVTIAYSSERYRKISFKKSTYPISSLSKSKYLTVIVDDEYVELAKAIISISKNPHVKFAMVGKLERKKLPNTHQFINFKKYLSMDSKPFMRVASALLYKRVVEDFKKVSSENSIFEKCLKPYVDDVAKLSSFSNENIENCGDIEQMVLDVAIEKNLFDLQHADAYKRVRDGIKKYDFINLLAEPYNWDIETKKRYDTLINQILLFRKKFYNDLEGAYIIFEDKKTNKHELVQDAVVDL